MATVVKRISKYTLARLLEDPRTADTLTIKTMRSTKWRPKDHRHAMFGKIILRAQEECKNQ